MAADLTTLDALAINLYLKGLPDYVNKQHPLFMELDRMEKKDFRGRKLIIAGKTADAQHTAWVAEAETLPPGDNVGVVNMEILIKYLYGVGRITAQARNLIDNEGGFADALTTEMDSKRDRLTDDLAIQAVYGAGFGDIGQVSAYNTTTNVLTLIAQPTVGGMGSRLFQKNMRVSFYTATSGGSLHGNGAEQVTAINSTSTVTLNVDPASIGANDYVFRANWDGTGNDGQVTDPRSKSIMGLGGIVDGTARVTTIQNVDRSVTTELQALVLGNSSVLRGISDVLLNDLLLESWTNGGGKYGDFAYCPVEIQKRIAALFLADRRYNMPEMELKGGFKAIAWTGPGGSVPIFADRYARPNEVACIRKSDLFWVTAENMGFVNDDGRMFRYTDRTDTVEFWLRWWGNLACRQFNNHAVLRDISHTA